MIADLQSLEAHELVAQLTQITDISITPETVIFTPKTQEWCKLPYERAGKKYSQCPNYDKNPLCPPKYPYRGDLIKKYHKIKLIYAHLDFKTFKATRKLQHKKWSEDQCGNSRHWQPTLKKLLKQYIRNQYFVNKKPLFKELLGVGSGFWGYASCEAAGCYVYRMLELNEIPFDRKAQEFILMVALLLFEERGPLDKFV